LVAGEVEAAMQGDAARTVLDGEAGEGLDARILREGAEGKGGIGFGRELMRAIF
jgi:hypothetical protein